MRCSSCDDCRRILCRTSVFTPCGLRRYARSGWWARACPRQGIALRREALRGHRDRRRRARRRPPHRARRRADAGVHAGRDEGDASRASHPDEVRAVGAHDPARQHLPPALPAGRGADRRARRPARASWAGTGRSSPTRAASRSSRCATRCSRSTTTASRSARSTTATPARFTPELAAAIQAKLGSDIAMCLDVCPPAGVPRAELEEAVRLTTLWATRQRDGAARAGPARLRDHAGRRRPRAARALGRGDRARSASTATRSAGSRSARTAAGDVRGGRVGGAAPAGRAAALLHGDRRPGGDPRRDRARDRHVRLRAADADRADRHGAHLGRAASTSATPASPATRGRSTSAAPARRARGSRAPTSATCEPAGAARPAAAHPAQSALPARS